MIQEETLRETGRREYEDPKGEYLELISQGSNTITVLTRVDADKVGVGSPPVDPDSMTVSELEDALDDEDYDWNDRALDGLIEAERDGKDRKTAIEVIEERKS